MPHVLTLVEQFWHKVPGGTAKATERTLAALIDRNEFTITGLSAAHRRSRLDQLGPEASSGTSIEGWAGVPAGVKLRRHWLPRPALYESWLRFDRPSVDNLTTSDSVFWASSSIVAPTYRPVVSTIHDLDFLDDPSVLSARGRDFFPRMWARALARSDRFVCPSEVVARQCVRHGVDEAQLRVVPWGVDRPQCPPTLVDEEVAQLLARVGVGQSRLPDGAVLLIAPDQPRKNPAVCAEVAAELGCPLVIVGPGADAGQPDFFARLGAAVIRVGVVSNRELSALYQQAAALLFPSLAEGFGFPVAEAMTHGLPVVTSAGTATEEVAGGAAVLVDPNDASVVAKAVDVVLSDTGRRADLIEGGLARAAELTWGATAEGYARVFREVL